MCNTKSWVHPVVGRLISRSLISVKQRGTSLVSGCWQQVAKWPCSCMVQVGPFFPLRRSGTAGLSTIFNSLLKPPQHHPGKFAEACMHNPPFCFTLGLGLQNVTWTVICRHDFWKNAYSFFAKKCTGDCRNQYRPGAWNQNSKQTNISY